MKNVARSCLVFTLNAFSNYYMLLNRSGISVITFFDNSQFEGIIISLNSIFSFLKYTKFDALTKL